MRLCIVTSLLNVVVLAQLAAAAIVISDDFDGANHWTTTIFSVNGSTGSSGPEVSGGNPDGFRSMFISLPRAPSGQRAIGAVVNFRDGFQYNPALQGPVISFEMSFDHRRIVSSSGQMGAGLAVRQDGEIYVATLFGLTPGSTWQNEQAMFTLTDFVRLDSTNLIDGLDNLSQPDFSTAGAPFEVGFFARNSTSLGGLGYDRTYGIDNLNITVIPEVSTVTLLLGAFSFCLLARRRPCP